MPVSTSTLATTTGTNLSSTLNNVVGRVADLASLDFLLKRNNLTQTPERIVNVPPVKDIQGPSFPVFQNPLLIGGFALASIALIVLVIRK